MTGIEGQRHYAILTDSSGARYDLPTYDLAGQPAPISLSPQEAFDQVSIVGDTEKVADRRASQIIPAIQTGGAGRDEYTETEGVDDFRESDCDTRFAGAIVVRPERTALGTIVSDQGVGQRVWWGGWTGATIHTYLKGGRGKYWNGSGWVNYASPVAGYVILDHELAFGYGYVSANDSVYRTSDGINWTRVGAGPVKGASFDVHAICAHDNKLYAAVVDHNVGQLELYACADPTNPTPTAAAWARVATSPILYYAELTTNMASWRDAAGSPMLVIQTTQRLIAYNAIAAQLIDYDNYFGNNPEGGPPTPSRQGICLAHFKSTGDLYAGQGAHCDYLMRYSPGAGFEKVGPNKNGGLTRVRQGVPVALAQNAYGLGVWTMPTAIVGDATSTTEGGGGGAWFLDAQGGWHTLNRQLGTGVAQPYPLGGGIGGRKIWTVWSDGTVEQQDLPNVGGRPQFAVGRRYDVNLLAAHRYARTDGGTSLLTKTLLGFTAHTLLSDGSNAFGLDPSTDLFVNFRIDGGPWLAVTQYKGTDGVTRAAPGGSFSAGLPAIGWPLRLVVNPPWGLRFRDLDWRFIARTGDPTKTPVVVFVAPRYRKKPFPRYTYEFVTDLSQAQVAGGLGLGGPYPLPGGYSPNRLHEILVGMDRSAELVSLTYGVQGEEVTVEACEFAMAPQLLPHLGVGRYRIVLRDVTTDASG